MSDDIQCPFCKQEGFDLIGLKDHFIRHCDKYHDTISVEQEREDARKEKS